MKQMELVPPPQKLPTVKEFENKKIPGFSWVGVETKTLPKWNFLSRKDQLVDIMPTLCEAAGATYPKQYKGGIIPSHQGISMLPFIKSAIVPPEDRTVYWQHENHAAIRQGNWKLVTINDRSDKQWELYNLSQDRSETENLASKHPFAQF